MIGGKIISNKIVVFADTLDQFNDFKKNEKFYNTNLMVYFQNPEDMLKRLNGCIILDIRKTDKHEKYIRFINNYTIWKKIN